jgi:hypothetical protein
MVKGLDMQGRGPQSETYPTETRRRLVGGMLTQPPEKQLGNEAQVSRQRANYGRGDEGVM